MEFTITPKDNINILALRGSLLADVQTRDILDKVSGLVQEGKVNFVVDMSELKFINSAGLGMLLTCLLKTRKSRGDMVLTSVPEQVTNLLNITKLAAVFNTAETVDEAIKKFSSQ